MVTAGDNSFPKLRLLTFKEPIDPHDRDGLGRWTFAWNPTIELLLNRPWPSLMKIEFKYYYGNLPPAGELSKWKVSKRDYGNIAVMERI